MRRELPALLIGALLGAAIVWFIMRPDGGGNGTIQVNGRDTVVVSAAKYDTVVVSLKKGDTVVVSVVDYARCLQVPRPDDCPPVYKPTVVTAP
jgi:hypothetical protein